MAGQAQERAPGTPLAPGRAPLAVVLPKRGSLEEAHPSAPTAA